MIYFVDAILNGAEGAFVYVLVSFYAFLALNRTKADPKSIKYYALFLLYSAGIYIIGAGLMVVLQLI